MMQNFQWNLKRHGITNDKMVGIFGSFHVKQADDPSDPKFAALVKKNNLVSTVDHRHLVRNGTA